MHSLLSNGVAVMAVLVGLASTQTTVAVSPPVPTKLAKTWDKQNNFWDQFYVRDRAYFQKVMGVNDPTNGFVDYANSSDALKSGMMAYKGNQVYIGADNKTKVASNGVGRKAVRLESKSTFDKGLLIADIQHMPGSACGSWPAFWLFDFQETPYAEIDIIEGNGWPSQTANTVSAHTCGQCSFPSLTGEEVRKECNLGGSLGNCDDGSNYDGCGKDIVDNSYGNSFNKNNGGVYATLIDTYGIRIWFWPRNKIPADITAGKPVAKTWGTPVADLRGSTSSHGCDVPKRFKSMSIVINLSFCGDIIYDWGEQTRDSPQCGASKGSTCNGYVGSNPSAYTDSYWLFNSIKLYQ